jgi:hypothetical protein
VATALIRALLATAVLFATANAAASDAVVLFRDRARAPERRELAKLSELRAADVTAIWVWSENTPPRRVELHDAQQGLASRSGAQLAVRIATEGLEKDARLRLLAAPVAMWEEAPEDLLPRWTVQPGSTTRIPVERGEIWRVRVTGPGFGTWWLDVPPDRATVVLAPLVAKDHELKIVDDAGIGLAAARLSLLDEAPERGGSKKLADHRADARGRVSLRAIPDVAGLLLVASTPTRAPRVVQARPSSLPASIVLSPGATVRGRVTDADGKAVAGARVGVRTWIAENVPVPLLRESESAADGTWELPALPAGRGEWRASARGFAPASRALTLGATLVDLGTIVLDPETRVAVTVRDDRGDAVSGAQLRVRDTVVGATDAEGRATVPATGGRSFEIIASAPRHRSATTTVEAPFPKLVEIVLSRAFRITGRLVDESGTPLADAAIRAVRGTTLSRHQTDAAGRFELDLDAGFAHTLEFRSTQAALVSIDVAEGPAGDTRDLGDVTAPSGIIVTGTLVREDDGTPVTGARVWLPRPSEAGALMAWAFRDVLQTVTDSAGAFRLAGLPETPFELRIDAPSLATARRAVTPDAKTRRVELSEIRLRAGTNVVVRVEGNAGEGAEARIDLGGRGLPIDTLRATVVAGRASIAQVPAGDVVVTVWRGRNLLCREPATIAGAADVEVVCSMRKVAVSGRVDVGGHPAGPGTIVWLSTTDDETPTGVFNFGSGAYRQQQVFAPDSATESMNVGYDGRFTGQLLPGTWDVLWMPDTGQAVGPRRIDVPRAATHQVALSYPAAVLHGRVVDAHGKPVAGADVRELSGRGMALSREDGTFVLSGPPAGRWEVQARHAGRASAVLGVDVEENRRADPVEIVLDAAANAVRVRVVADRAPAAGAIVFVETDAGELRLATASADGTASIEFLPPAPTRVRAAASAGGRWVFGPWTGVKDTIVLDVRPTGTIVLQSDGARGNVGVTTQDGWRVDRLLQWIGAFVQLAPDAPSLIAGLPAGTYDVVVGNERKSVIVRANETTETEWK